MAAKSFTFSRPLNLKTIDEVAQWAEAVVTELESAFNEQRKVLELVTLHAEPVKLYDGLIIIADGSDWDPGSGAGAYRYGAASWHFLG